MSRKSETLERKKQALIQGLANARSSLLEAIRSLPENQIDEEFLGSWSVKELLAHLIGWDWTNLQAVREILAGQYPSFFQKYDKDWQSYNRELVERYRKEDWAELLIAALGSHRELISTLQALSADELVNGKARKETGRTVTIRNLLLSEAKDEATHTQQVNAFKNLDPGRNI
jgi:hypothetical protein